jgi:hypothetical protein
VCCLLLLAQHTGQLLTLLLATQVCAQLWGDKQGGGGGGRGQQGTETSIGKGFAMPVCSQLLGEKAEAAEPET